MYLCVDCADARGPVVWFDPNSHVRGTSWDKAFIPLATSTEEWLAAWVADVDLFDRLVPARTSVFPIDV
jgi:hypothetical protein